MTGHTAGSAQAYATITNPRDGSAVGEVSFTSDADTRGAVAAARAAFCAWRTAHAEERRDRLRAAAAALAARAADLSDLEQRETGRLREDSRGGIAAAVDTLRQYAELAPLHRGRSLRGGSDAIDLMRAEPRGVVAVIPPWNDPVAIAAGLIGAALATGNVVVYKPSERCPHVGQLLGDTLAASFPPGVVTTVLGDGGIGDVLVSSPDVDAIAHVGASATGERIVRTAALTGAHVIRENGGNDALIVDAGVDPAWAAAQAAIGAFAGGGQLCTAVERIFVHRGIADAFIRALTAEAEQRNTEASLPPLVDHRMRDEVDQQVTDSIAQGARAVVGGAVPDGPGCWYPATVLVDCEPTMPVFSAETFGPVAPVMVVDDFAAALRCAIDDDYGLAATVLTADMAHATQAAAELPVGTVKVNSVFGGAPGGAAEPRGRSGSGFGFGPELLDELTTVKVVHISPAVTP